MSNDINNINSVSVRSPASQATGKANEQAETTGLNSTSNPEAPTRVEDSHGVSRQISQLSEMSEHLANLPDVDSAKVARIKQAIADGTFEIDPAKVAQSLIDFETSAMGNKK